MSKSNYIDSIITEPRSDGDGPRPECGYNDSRGVTWRYKPSSVYPAGYPRLCSTCFEEADGYRDEEYDHEDDTDVFVLSASSCHSERLMHRPTDTADARAWLALKREGRR